MLRMPPIMSGFLILIIMIICMKNVCSAQEDNRKCLVYEDVVTTESPIVTKDIKTVLFDKHMDARIKVKYGQHVKLICNINPSSSMEVKWKAGSIILSTDKVLDIKSVTEEYHGVYITCEASVHSELMDLQGAHILLSDLAPPLISELTPSKVTVIEKDKITLACKLIKGTPQPTVHWQVKIHGAKEFEDLSTTGEELTVKVSTVKDSGLYRCNAKNMKGEDLKTIDVTVQKAPVLNIKEPSEMTFDYGSTKEFTCKISGYPLPKSIWKDSSGNKLTSKDAEINWHEKISKLKVKSMKRSNNYSCFAGNSLGDAADSVKVTVLSPFLVHEYPEDSTQVHYSASTNIVCNITSSFPMTIKWLRPKIANSSEQIEIHNDQKFEIADGVLEIKSVDLEMVGKYTCEASLVSDNNEKISYTTDLQINDLAPPTISDTSKLSVMESTDITLSCHIDGGVPRPTMSWQVMSYANKTYTDLNISTEELDIENITIDETGKYRCVSKNAVGEWNKVTEVKVKKAPWMIIEEGSEVSVDYGSNNTFTCQVVGYPLPTVTWKDAQGTLLKPEETVINEHEITSKITVDVIRSTNQFNCHANNSLGSTDSSINVTVLSPFVVYEKPEAETNVHYAASADIICNITASFPITIQWYHNETKVDTAEDQTVLHINSMDLDDIGNYRCEATIISDKSQIKEFSTLLKIDDLRAPVITFYNGNNVAFNKFEELSLTCTAHGNPQPVVTWQHQLSGNPLTTVGTGETLCSTHASRAQTGLYKCIATNVAGMDSRTITVSCPSC